jgi:type IV pilus assembly protein PilM
MTATLTKNEQKTHERQDKIGLSDLKNLFKCQTLTVIGLDIGSDSVKAVQLHKEKKSYVLDSACIVQIPYVPGSDTKKPNTIQTIKDCIQECGVETPYVVCSICGPEVAVRYFTFPHLKPAEIESAVNLEASQVCPFNIHDASVDYQVVSTGDNKTKGFLVAATKTAINEKTSLVEEVSLKPAMVDVDGLALLNCFNEVEKVNPNETIAILNIGRSFSNLAILGTNRLPFIRDIAFGSGEIMKVAAQMNNIHMETMQRIIQGQAADIAKTIDVNQSLKAGCSKLVTNINETLRYYSAQEKAASVRHIYICGGFALTEGIESILSEQMKIKCSIWNPFKKINCNGNLACQELVGAKGPALAAAAGLAMRLI